MVMTKAVPKVRAGYGVAAAQPCSETGGAGARQPSRSRRATVKLLTDKLLSRSNSHSAISMRRA